MRQRTVKFVVTGTRTRSTMISKKRTEREGFSRWGPTMALALAAASGVGCGKTAAGDGGQGAPQAMPVQVKIAQAQKIPDTTEYLSILKSRHSATINPQVEGQITKIFVKSGARGAAGAPLLQLRPLTP